MKIAQIKLLKAYNVLIAGLLTLIGYACVTDPNVEYGSPSAKFIVNGRVSSSLTDLPIEGVKVVLQEDSTTTDRYGKYQVVDDSRFPADQSYRIKFQDIDDETNGHFNDLDTIVEFIEPTFIKGDGDWYIGETSIDLDIQLTPKQ